ncbi:hypothetical protein JOQ06_011688, partial [Pogonophryne albipinna]
DSLKTSRSNAEKLTKALLKKRVQVKVVEFNFREVNYISEQCQKKFEETSVNARILEPPMFYEIRPEYNRYLNILLKRPPSEWQEALRTTDLREPARAQGSERGLDSSAGGVLPPPHTDTLVTDGNVDGDSSQSEEKLELFSSEPHQILDLVTEFTDQVLKMGEDDEKLTLQLDEMKDRIASDQKRAATLKRKVQLNDSLKTEDHDTMSDALGVKIREVFRCCVDSRLTYLSTLEKLSSFLESIPKGSLETLRLIKDNNRLREEQLKLEREKHLEMLKKCKQRSMDEPKKKTGRKLRPRCFPVEQKITVSEENNIPAEEELHAFLFSTEDDE